MKQFKIQILGNDSIGLARLFQQLIDDNDAITPWPLKDTVIIDSQDEPQDADIYILMCKPNPKHGGFGGIMSYLNKINLKFGDIDKLNKIKFITPFSETSDKNVTSKTEGKINYLRYQCSKFNRNKVWQFNEEVEYKINGSNLIELFKKISSEFMEAGLNQSVSSDSKETSVSSPELELRAQFLNEHKRLYRESKNGLLGFLRKSNVNYESSLSELLLYAKKNNNRSRQVCINLGWFNPDGTLNKSCPEEIKKQFSLEEQIGDQLKALDQDSKQPQNPNVREALKMLIRGDALTTANRNVVAIHAFPRILAKIIVTLQHANLLTDDEIGESNRTKLGKHRNSTSVLDGINKLHESGLLTGESGQMNFNTLISHVDPFSVANALILLQEKNLLNDKTRAVIANNQFAGSVAKILVILHGAGLLNDDSEGRANFEIIANHPNPVLFEPLLHLLDKKGLLTNEFGQVNFNGLKTIVTQSNLEKIEHALYRINNEGVFNRAIAQDILNYHIKYAHDFKKNRSIENALITLSNEGLIENYLTPLLNSESPDEFAKVVVALNQFGMLNDDNLRYVLTSKYPEATLKAISRFKEKKFFNDKIDKRYCELASSRNNPERMADIIYELHNAGLLTDDEQGQANFNGLKKLHESYYEVICFLKSAGLFDKSKAQSSFTTTISDDSIGALTIAHALGNLRTDGIYTNEPASLYHAITSHEKPSAVAEAITILYHNTKYPWYYQFSLGGGFFDLETKTLIENNLMTILSHKNPHHFATIFKEIHSRYKDIELATLVMRTLFQLELGRSANNVQDVMILLHQNNLFTKTNCDLINNDQTVFLLYWFLSYQNIPSTQNNFMSIINNLEVLSECHLLRIHHGEFTQNNFAALIRLCETNPEEPIERRAARINAYIDRGILGINELPHGPQRPLNSAQSTHTASVHLTTDLTGLLLHQKYDRATTAPNLEYIEKQINEFKANEETTQVMIDAAKRCLNRIQASSTIINISPEQKKKCLKLIDATELKNEKSIEKLITELEADQDTTSITLNQFIDWAFQDALANNDAKPSVAIEAIIKTLYEIQRGYNLDAKGKDEKSALDSFICSGGSFNKITEIMSSLSPLIIFIFVNEETVALKIKQLTLNLLKTKINELHKDAQSGDDLIKKKFCDSIDHLSDPDKIGDVLEKIIEHKTLFDALIKEFGPIYEVIFDKDKLQNQIKTFLKDVLPYYPPINADSVTHYNQITLDWHAKMVEYKNCFKASLYNLTLKDMRGDEDKLDERGLRPGP